MFRAVDPKSALSVPLCAHGKRLGAMTFVSSAPGRAYGADDVRLAEDLAVRAALAIDNARLYREARRAIKARDDVLAVVAHDLRNPLNCVLMHSQMLVRRGPEPERRSQKQVQAIRRSATRMNRLIGDLLDVTRLEAGGLSVEQTRLPAGPVVSESVEAQKPLAASASLDLGVELPGDLPEVWADRERLLQVFENLIGNAIKFTGPGGHITVGASPKAGEDVFWVSDTGPGISPQDLPHVFDWFWQSLTFGRRGAGLGLPIAKGIVEAHGGHIWVESEPARGSTFFFTIPTGPLSGRGELGADAPVRASVH